jgi:hypothetical protein
MKRSNAAWLASMHAQASLPSRMAAPLLETTAKLATLKSPRVQSVTAWDAGELPMIDPESTRDE